MRKSIKIALFPIFLALLSAPAFAQVGSLRGEVIGEDGEGLQGALIKIERTDIKGNYQVKTKKKGQWFHAGLPLGTYNVAVEIKGQKVDELRGVRVGMSDDTPIVFNLQELKARQQQAQQAAGGGAPQITEEQIKAMSPEERKAYEEAIKQRQQQLSKNKELNEAFNLGMQARNAKNWQTAVENLAKAAEIDGTQDVVWANLADSQAELAGTKTGEDRISIMQDAIASYKKAIELKPENAAYVNNLGLAMVRSGDLEGGQQMLAKAADMDPVNGGRYFYNLGAVMINSGNTDAAIEAFEKATKIDPNYAEAYYQLGTALVGKAETKDDGTVVPPDGTVEAFQKYVELKPNGPMAESAQMMIQSLSGAVDTVYRSPGAKK